FVISSRHFQRQSLRNPSCDARARRAQLFYSPHNWEGEHVDEEFRAVSVAKNGTNSKTTFLEHRQFDTSVFGRRLNRSDVFGGAPWWANDHGHNFWNCHRSGGSAHSGSDGLRQE